MARIILTTTLIVLLNILVGCGTYDTGRGRLVPAQIGSGAAITEKVSRETDVVEQVVIDRQTYRQSLEMLVQHYRIAGNNMKMQWAQKELAALDTMPKYRYIIEAEVAGPNLKAKTSIPEADKLYEEALQLERAAGPIPVVKAFIKDENLLRLALEKYNLLISRHPSSDKIDDAAFRAGEIYEYFKDYTIALLYYQRTYQWDPQTPHPAWFRAAFILDKRLHRRAEALPLYQQAVEKAGDKYYDWKEFAERRIKELTKPAEGSQRR